MEGTDSKCPGPGFGCSVVTAVRSDTTVGLVGSSRALVTESSFVSSKPDSLGKCERCENPGVFTAKVTSPLSVFVPPPDPPRSTNCNTVETKNSRRRPGGPGGRLGPRPPDYHYYHHQCTVHTNLQQRHGNRGFTRRARWSDSQGAACGPWTASDSSGWSRASGR